MCLAGRAWHWEKRVLVRHLAILISGRSQIKAASVDAGPLRSLGGTVAFRLVSDRMTGRLAGNDDDDVQGCGDCGGE